MITLIGRLTFCMCMLLGVTVLLIRAQPDNDYSITELLPENCEAACFIGIQLGTTTDEEALNLLKASSWVDASSVKLIPLDPSSSKFDDLDHIQWDWSTNRPRLLPINPQHPDGNINIRNHKVDSIAFDTLIPAAAFYRLRGDPSVMVFMPIRNGEPWLIEWGYTYTNAEFNLQMQVRPCPYLPDLWLQPLHIQMSKRVPVQTTTTALTTTNINLRTVLNARERRICGLS